MLEANRQAETGSVVAPDDETYTKSLSGETLSEPKKIQPMSIEVKAHNLKYINERCTFALMR